MWFTVVIISYLIMFNACYHPPAMPENCWVLVEDKESNSIS
uniref:Uncharacterized protein n=1 Tax=Heterorhabditis bacteriophora TaxID=37862 RepID=A0A1I7XG37_HETBA